MININVDKLLDVNDITQELLIMILAQPQYKDGCGEDELELILNKFYNEYSSSVFTLTLIEMCLNGKLLFRYNNDELYFSENKNYD